jgi:hypothetical protein
VERSGCGPLYKLSLYVSGGTEENHENLNQDSQPHGSRFDPGTPKI